MIVNVGNGKGGVNKTTFSIQLALYAAEKGKKTLLIDLDGQEDLSRFLGKNKEYKGAASEVLFADKVDTVPAFPVENWQCRNEKLSEYLFYIPANVGQMANINNSKDVSILANFKRNVKALEKVFDVIIIDTPPSLGLCQYASLCAATSSVLPCIPDFDTCGEEKMVQYFSVYNSARRNNNKELGMPVVVLTSVDAKGEVVQSYIKWARKYFQTSMVEKYIEWSAAVRNSLSQRRAIWFKTASGNDRAKGASYRRVVESVFDRLV